MQLLLALRVLTTLLLLPLTNAVSRDGRDDFDTISIYGWPLSAEKPAPIALIKLDDPLLADQSAGYNRTANVFSYSGAKMLSEPSEVVRVGILDPVSKNWSGSVVGRDAFNSSFDREFVVHYDRGMGRVWHVHLEARGIPQQEKLKGKKKKQALKEGRVLEEQRTKGLTTVKLVIGGAGAEPVLNKPVVLNEDGKLQGADGADNRSFLQKYWWAIALFLVINVVAGGGGGES